MCKKLQPSPPRIFLTFDGSFIGKVTRCIYLVLIWVKGSISLIHYARMVQSCQLCEFHEQKTEGIFQDSFVEKRRRVQMSQPDLWIRPIDSHWKLGIFDKIGCIFTSQESPPIMLYSSDTEEKLFENDYRSGLGIRCPKYCFSMIKWTSINPFPAVDKYICYGVFAQHARAHEQLVHLSSLHDHGKV